MNENKKKEDLEKNVRKIKAILRLMREGVMGHQQARMELREISKVPHQPEIMQCAVEAMKAVEKDLRQRKKLQLND